MKDSPYKWKMDADDLDILKIENVLRAAATGSAAGTSRENNESPTAELSFRCKKF